jgi:hypothetical protein
MAENLTFGLISLNLVRKCQPSLMGSPLCEVTSITLNHSDCSTLLFGGNEIRAADPPRLDGPITVRADLARLAQRGAPGATPKGSRVAANTSAREQPKAPTQPLTIIGWPSSNVHTVPHDGAKLELFQTEMHIRGPKQ